MAHDYTKLRELLSHEEFPHQYRHKFIGDHSAEFADAVAGLEKRFPKLRRAETRESSGGKHLALTYVLSADSADEIIRLIQATEKLAALRVIL